MNFTPIPENDFLDFIETYFSYAKELFPAIDTATGKWEFIDLIPGMSDFDTRLILKNGMQPEDWVRMSEAIGHVHYEVWRKHPDWARKLEHTPGVNLTWEELASKQYYYPEFQQWSGYCGDTKRFEQERRQLVERGWQPEDEIYHLKRFFTYFGPYSRSIDPPINMGAFTTKYPLHSRMMHYFLPPLQSALSILRRQTIRGKFETLYLAQDMFPELKTPAKILHALEHHYEVPLLYREPYITILEQELEQDLRKVYAKLSEAVTCIDPALLLLQDTSAAKNALKRVNQNVSAAIFSSLRFSRLLKGRLYFYTHVDERFQTAWLIQNELGRICELFLGTPLRLFYTNRFPDTSSISIADMITNLTGDVFSREEAAIIRTYYETTKEPPEKGTEIESARRVMEIFDDFFLSIQRLNDSAPC